MRKKIIIVQKNEISEKSFGHMSVNLDICVMNSPIYLVQLLNNSVKDGKHWFTYTDESL